MAVTRIEWAVFTFNPWRGCTKVSPGCVNCYADKLSHQNPKTLGVWGKNGTRVHGVPSYFNLPFKWAKWAREGTCYACAGKGAVKTGIAPSPVAGNPGNTLVTLTMSTPCPVCNGKGNFGAPYRPRVFCASLADVFENFDTLPDGMFPVVQAWRDELVAMIAMTPELDWLLLTKRSAFAREYLTGLADVVARIDRIGNPWVRIAVERKLPVDGFRVMEWPLKNLWLGVSVEDQKRADERIPDLIATPAAVRFLSVEPMVGPIEFSNVTGRADAVHMLGKPALHGIDWVIVGGESGSNARPMYPGWVTSIRNQCLNVGVKFLFKQWGEYEPAQTGNSYVPEGTPGRFAIVSEDGSSISGLNRCPKRVPPHDVMQLTGKHAAGRILGGRTWDELPEPPAGNRV